MAKKKGNGKELAVVGDKEYAMVREAKEVAEIIQENLGGQKIDMRDLDIIKVPGSGGIAWEVPSITGIEAEKEVVGVILGQKDIRAYWKTSFEDAPNQPPDCFSEDTYSGVGDPGGECRDCPFAVFGSADDGEGRGQACSHRKLLFILRAGDLLPTVISVPPTSLKAIKKKFLQCASKRIRITDVEFGFTLEKDKNKDGISFSKIVPEVKRTLSPKMKEHLKAFARIFSPQAVIDTTARTEEIFSNE